jgi:tripartite-type tricarboxylate transporter receptor subunit TctC
MILVGPKGLPEAITKKLGETFKKGSESAAFQSKLASLDLPYDYKGQLNWKKKFPSSMRRGRSC